MEEKDLDLAFEKLKKELPVNEGLKRNLRQSFVPAKRPWMRRILIGAAAAVVAAAVFITGLLSPEDVVRQASAASLKIFNQVSFVEIGSGGNLGVSEYRGTVYVPVAGRGLFAYDSKGFHKLLDKEVNFVRVSPDGRKLALSADGTVSIYDLSTRKRTELLKGDNSTVYYEQPSWSPDNRRLVYTKKTVSPATPGSHGFTEDNRVYEMDLESRETRELAKGAYPSYAGGADAVVLERDGRVISRSLKDNKEKVIDSGRFPSVSPDGGYVAYVKTEHTEREAAKNARVAEDVDNVWVADTGGAQTKRRVTANFARPFIEVKDWLKGLKPSGVTQVLNFSGNYSYYEPAWSSDSAGIFVLKNTNIESNGGMRLVRIQFTTEKLSAGYTVRKFLQALVMRDDDYAKSLMNNPPAALTMSNPHQVGYRILKTGQDGGKDYVDAEIFSAYTAQPDYMIAQARFYLSPNDNGYIIDRVDFKEGITVSAGDGGAVYLTTGKQKKMLFRDEDIPSEFAAKGPHRLASLAYSPTTDTLVFTVQALQSPGQSSSVTVLTYNLSTQRFGLTGRIREIGGKTNVGVANLIVGSSGKYAALDLFSDDDPAFKSYALVYSLEDARQPVELNRLFEDSPIETVRTNYWDEDRLIFNAAGSGQSMGYIYAPAEEAVKSF